MSEGVSGGLVGTRFKSLFASSSVVASDSGLSSSDGRLRGKGRNDSPQSNPNHCKRNPLGLKIWSEKQPKSTREEGDVGLKEGETSEFRFRRDSIEGKESSSDEGRNNVGAH